MALVRLLGFSALSCGCVVGRYREVGTGREVRYVEEKASSCRSKGHRRNQTIASERPQIVGTGSMALHAS
jgi:hypothetical protein